MNVGIYFLFNMDLSEQERNELAKKYLPLVKKISTKMYKNSSMDYEEIEGFAWAGFTKAMDTYDPSLSNMTFLQFAGFGIRNAILNGQTQNGSTIKISYYMRKKMKERGEEIPSTVSLDKNFENEDHLPELGIEEDFLDSDNSWNLLKERLEAHFPEDWTDIFYSVYGLYGKDVEKSKDIAKRQGISGCLVTKRMKKMIEYIQSDKELCDILRELL